MEREYGNKRSWGRWSGRDGRYMRESDPLYEELAARIKARLDRRMNVLELACGTGLLSQRIAGSVRNLEATDDASEQIEAAKRKPHSVRLHYSVQDAAHLPYGPETFDAVVAVNALHIMPEPEQVLREAHRVLKRGGLLIASTFVSGEGSGLRPRSRRMGGFKACYHWDAQGFEHLVSQCGFTAGACVMLDSGAAPLCYLEARRPE